MRPLTKIVLETLRDYPQTRNSDITLTIKIWENYYGDKIKTAKNGLRYVQVEDLFELPREDAIKRYRAKIQNEDKMYPPTDPKITRQRKKNEKTWQTDLGYSI